MNFDKKPEVFQSPELGKIVRQVLGMLNTKDDKLFQRNGKICLCHQQKEDIDDKYLKIPIGTTVVRYLSVQQIKMKLADKFYFKKLNYQGEEKQCLPSNDVCENIHQSIEFPNISVLKGITNYPIINEKGEVNYNHGYDTDTGYFYDKILDFPRISKNLTQKEANLALLDLRDIFCDFPFISICDCDVLISAALSIMCRPMFDGTNIPIFACEAPVQGSGKSLMFDIINIILTGLPMVFQKYPNKEEEIDKTILAAAMVASGTLCFDNVTPSQRFGSPVIDSITTCNGRFEGRILGKSEIARVNWNTVMFVNGNNILSSIKSETIRRVIPMRIEPETDRPKDRTGFKYEDIDEYVKNNRVRFINDLMTIISAWIQNGKIGQEKFNMGSFKKWAKTIPPAIVWAGGENILENADNLGFMESEEETETIEIFELLSNRFVNGFKTSDIMDILSFQRNDIESNIKNKIVGFFGNINEISPKRISGFLSSHKGRTQGNFKLVEVGSKNTKHKGSKLWNIVKLQNNGNKNEIKVDKIIEKDLFSDIISKVDEDEIPF